MSMVTRDSPALEWGIDFLTKRLRSNACNLRVLVNAPSWEDLPRNNPHWRMQRRTYGRLLNRLDKLSMEVPF